MHHIFAIYALYTIPNCFFHPAPFSRKLRPQDRMVLRSPHTPTQSIIM